jgi:predicted RNA-binding protein Jag
MSDDELEELVTIVEKETSEYLKQLLSPKTDFNVSVSIEKTGEAVNVSIDVTIRGRLQEYREEARDAVNYAKRKLVEVLESMRNKFIKYD